MPVCVVHFASKTELFTLHECDIIPAKDEIIQLYNEDEEEQHQKKFRVVRVIHICEPVYGDSKTVRQTSLEVEVVECT